MGNERDRRGIAVITGVVVVVGGLLGVRAMVGGGPRPDARNCVGAPTASTVILFDRSDDVSDQTLAEMRTRALAYVRDSAVNNELVSLFSISALSAHSLTPLASLCKPRRSGNRLYENPALIEQGFKARFEKPITDALASVTGPARESPLAQAFVDLSLTQYLGTQRNRLVVFSDMMENTPRFSLYRCSEADMLRQFRASRQGAVQRPRFVNTFVSLHIIPRLGLSDRAVACRDKLWVWFFGDNSGPHAGLDFRFLPGGPPPPRS